MFYGFYAVFILDEPSAFYAEEIYDAVSSEGTNDPKLIQIFLKRAEVHPLYCFIPPLLARSIIFTPSPEILQYF